MRQATFILSDDLLLVLLNIILQSNSKMLHEIIRFFTQQRAIHCYVLLSLWIFLLVAGLYKFLEPTQRSRHFLLPRSESVQIYKTGMKTKRIFKNCNRLEDLILEAEGKFNVPNWTLRGIIIVIRHGDRGPLQHIRNISNINCGTRSTPILNAYQNYIRNISLTSHLTYMQTGPFHGFPYLPATPNQCDLGQLTMQGIAQLLQTGAILDKAYNNTLKFKNMTASDVVVYCTRYRRTFQSVLAMLFPILPREVFNKIVITESPSLSFCFDDCACATAEHYLRLLNKKVKEQFILHPAVVRLVRQAAELVFTQLDEALLSNPLALRDALLTYICHDSILPCASYTSCLRSDHVSALFAYTEWDNHQRWKNKHWKNVGLLKSYGLFKNIVSYMLKMASETSPKVVIYSGHDYTLQYLSIALGITSEHATQQYASRLIIEVYQNEGLSHTGPKGFYFKLIMNGKDVTREILFCRKHEIVYHNKKKNYFCKMEDIVRFIHDDYFSGLNVTNFKDACSIHKDKNPHLFLQ